VKSAKGYLAGMSETGEKILDRKVEGEEWKEAAEVEGLDKRTGG